jgi:CO/xanthine dehydrogenase Mo-binding subunit/aerobic-type carbon monoxide dehydrogenase small subunit (CoxS/CutS family)
MKRTNTAAWLTAAMTSAVVNGKFRELSGPPGRSLLAFLRADLGLTGTKPGCGEGECGACTVLVDGAAMLACRTTLGEAAGRSVTTIEGLAAGGRLHPIQQALVEERASQCGYCTPGMALRAAALLAADADPGDDQIVAALEQNVCRCGCYPRLVRAVHRAAVLLSDLSQREPGPGPAPAAQALGRPRRPWDLCRAQEQDWFDILGDGLVTVWQPSAQPADTGPAGGGAWVHVAPSGAVTAFTGKVDVGQDNQTAFRLLAAEELAVDPEVVRVVQGDTDLCPFDIGTFGSRSMPDAGESLRRAAAGARQVLLSLAAQRWGVPVAGLAAAAGTVTSGTGGRSLGYGELLTGVRRLEVLASEPPLTQPAAWHFAGHPGHAASRLYAVTGDRRFVSDLELPGMLHGAVLRPPVPGSRLRSADPGPARQLPGVTIVRDVDFIGVTAPSPATARQAIAAIKADWEQPSPGPADMAGYLRAHPTAGAGWERPVDSAAGDPGAALAGAAVRLDATYTTAYLAHVPLETRAAVAEWDGGRLTVWTGNNVLFAVRAQLAGAFGLDETDVRVIVPPTGGGFGGKHGDEAIEAARLARAAGCPVKVHWSRAEEFQWGYLRPMAVIDIRAGLDAGGSITAWDFLDINGGAQGISFPYAAATHRLRYQPAASLLPQGPYRGLAATANTFARESAIDELASAAGADPLQFRLDRLGDERLAAVVRAAATRFGWGTGAGSGMAGRHRGWGIAAGLEKGGRVATCAEVAAEADGGLRVTRIVTAYECGAVVNPDTVHGQIEGGIIMALGGALFEQVDLDHGRIASPSLAAYRVPRFSDVPAIDVVLVDRPDNPSAGAGETPLIAVAPAIANAIFAATGQRLRSLPLIPDGSRRAG